MFPLLLLGKPRQRYRRKSTPRETGRVPGIHDLMTRGEISVTFCPGNPLVLSLIPFLLLPGELCDEVIDHCVPEMSLCQHEAKCVSLDKGFR